MDLSYSTVKSVHVGTAALTITLFVIRVGWMLWSPGLLQQRWVKVVPHVIDTVLLVSALWLAWQLGAAGTHGWLAAKVIGLVVYIALGTIAIKRGRTRGVRLAAALAAIATFGYIVSVALTESPLGFFARL